LPETPDKIEVALRAGPVQLTLAARKNFKISIAATNRGGSTVNHELHRAKIPVSGGKYIGGTERIFSAAGRTNAILFLDEANGAGCGPGAAGRTVQAEWRQYSEHRGFPRLRRRNSPTGGEVNPGSAGAGKSALRSTLGGEAGSSRSVRREGD
jgi:hypothetical protein